MARRILTSLAAFAIAYAIVLAGMYFGQRSLQYHPSHKDAAGVGDDTFKPWRRDSDGEFLAYVREPRGPASRVAVVFHGNAGEALNWKWTERIFPEDQALVLAEYPGYGPRGGAPTEGAIFEAASEIVDLVVRRWGLPVTVFGESLGSGVAVYAARRPEVDRLALVSPYSSIADVAAYYYPIFPVRQMLLDRFDSMLHAASLTTRLHIAHSDVDWTVPHRLGRRLFDAYPGPHKAFTTFRGYRHGAMRDALTADTPEAREYRAFLAAPLTKPDGET